MFTPNGRFEVKTRLCLTMSDYHPESWSQAWKVPTLLNGLLSFMVTNDCGHIGGISSTSEERKKLAKESLETNKKNPKFCELFPELCGSSEPAKSSVTSTQPKVPAAVSTSSSGSQAKVKVDVSEDEKIARELQALLDKELREQEARDLEFARQLADMS